MRPREPWGDEAGVLKRTLIGAAILGTLLGAWSWDRGRGLGPAWATAALGSLVLLGALDELLGMAGARGGRRLVGRLMGLAWLLILGLSALVPNSLTTLLGDLLAAASLAAGAMLAWQLRRGPGPAVARLGRSLWFAVPWVGGLACLVALLLGGGLQYAVAMTLVAKGSDIGGYFAGKLLGRRKLAPAVSPNKTWEGAFGGLLLSAGLALLLLGGVEARPSVLRPDRSLSDPVLLPDDPALVALLGLLMGVLGIVSDLSESLVKRSLGAKDSGRLLGPAGGCLDLVDSLLLVGPFALAYTAILA